MDVLGTGERGRQCPRARRVLSMVYMGWLDVDYVYGMAGARLQEECGNQYTAKLESMFWDTKTSRDLAAEFKQRCKDSPELAGPGPDMTVQVLTQGAWPR